MHVLIVESNVDLGRLWSKHLERLGFQVTLVAGQDQAFEALHGSEISIIVLNVVLEQGSAFAVADYANYRFPHLKVVFVTSSSFFSDGSIFRHAANACAFMPSATPPEDLAAMVEHYAARL